MDRYEIKAEIQRRGSSLTAIAKAQNLNGSSCRKALTYPIPAANQAIAAYLGKSLHEVWPSWFDEQGRTRPGMSSATRRRSASSQKLGAI